MHSLLSRLWFTAIFAGSACSTGQWTPSQLAEQTIQTSQQATLAYHLCLDKYLKAYALEGDDPRDITARITKKCEDQLTPIVSAFEKENVPPQIIQRFLRQKRTQATRHILRLVMFSMAQNQSRKTDPSETRQFPEGSP